MVSRVEQMPRRAEASDAADIARLVLLSAEQFLPAVFGPRIEGALRTLAAGSGTLFSFRHAWVVDAGGQPAGMLLGYSGRQKRSEDPSTGLALFGQLGLGMMARFGGLLRLQSTLGRVAPGEWYVSNIAVYPAHRGAGIGAALMGRAEVEARAAGCGRVVLDVETDHLPARALYERLGYEQRAAMGITLAGRLFSFHRMTKKTPA